jgi:hypothetical protein
MGVKIIRIKLNKMEEPIKDTMAVLNTSALFSSLELKLKKVVSMPYIKITFKKEIYEYNSEWMPYSAGMKARVRMGVRK